VIWRSSAKAVAGVAAIALAIGLSAFVVTHFNAETADDVAEARELGPIKVAARTAEPTTAIWIGDSFTAGTGADNATQGYETLVSREFAWVDHTSAQGGTGYVANGHNIDRGFQAIPKRLAAVFEAYTAPDVLIFDAGRNDRYASLSETAQGATTSIERVHQQWPDTKIVVIAPFLMQEGGQPLGEEFVAFLRTETTKVGGLLIDPVSEGWIKPSITRRWLWHVDHQHPNSDGHKWIADHLVADFQRAGFEGPAE
jgi:lysophospholipase L1-like esterase